jgi:hypothetical protein
VDPYTKWYGDLSPRDQKRVSAFDSIYNELWGEPAPLPVLQAAVNQGLNRWEFEDAQMRNPAWWKTEAAADMAEPFDNFLAQLGFQVKKKPRGKGGGKGGGKRGGGKGPKPGDRVPPGQNRGPDDGRPVRPNPRPFPTPPGGNPPAFREVMD